jgi:hypothetical protein
LILTAFVEKIDPATLQMHKGSPMHCAMQLGTWDFGNWVEKDRPIKTWQSLMAAFVEEVSSTNRLLLDRLLYAVANPNRE